MTPGPDSSRRSQGLLAPRAGRLDRSATDLPLTPRDREHLVNVLADVFHTELAAAHVLDRVGFERRHWQFGRGTSREAWWRMFTLMSDGLLGTPCRRLIEAGLHERPFNEALLLLAERYGLRVRSKGTDSTDPTDLTSSLPEKRYRLAHNLIYRVPELVLGVWAGRARRD